MIKKYFEDWSMFEKFWLCTSITLLVITSYLWKSQWYGFVASITGMVCVVLAAKGRISNYDRRNNKKMLRMALKGQATADL
jgi:nicotinamide mononucleotide transporter